MSRIVKALGNQSIVKKSSLHSPSRIVRKKAQKRKIVSVRLSKERQETITKLILANREKARKLARSILRGWRVRMPSEDIYSIVDLALCESARRFSVKGGASFVTFFFYHIRGHLVRAVTKAAQASNVFMAYSRNNGIDVGDWAQGTVEPVLYYLPETFLLGYKESQTPEHELIKRERFDSCTKAIMNLDALEKEVIRRTYIVEQPLVDISKSVGFSRCHVSRVKKMALKRLRIMISTNEGEEVNEELPPSIESRSRESGMKAFMEKIKVDVPEQKRRGHKRFGSTSSSTMIYSSYRRCA